MLPETGLLPGSDLRLPGSEVLRGPALLCAGPDVLPERLLPGADLRLPGSGLLPAPDSLPETGLLPGSDLRLPGSEVLRGPALLCAGSDVLPEPACCAAPAPTCCNAGCPHSSSSCPHQGLLASLSAVTARAFATRRTARRPRFAARIPAKLLT